jgi:metallophosphoesterase (TIGR00282 family)
MSIRILCIGDVVGKPGRGVLAEKLKSFVLERNVDLVVCNAENAAGGSGMTPQILSKLINYGVDVVTLGDHAYRKADIFPVMANSDRIVRPVNLPPTSPGKLFTVVSTKNNMASVAVLCATGQLYMHSCDSPWRTLDETLAKIPADVKVRVVDFHAEASSEKIAMGYYLDGRVSVVFGTHTHIPTADAKILEGGTGYISDVGMTGPYDGVLGRRKDRVLSFLTTGVPAHFDVCTGDVRLCGVLATVSEQTGKTEAIERIEIAGKPHEGPVYDADDGRPGGKFTRGQEK